MAAAAARRRRSLRFALLRRKHRKLLFERLAAAGDAARRVGGADQGLELVAAGAAGILEDRHQAILPGSCATHLPSFSRISSGKATALRAAVSKHTSTVFWVAQCVMESAS